MRLLSHGHAPLTKIKNSIQPSKFLQRACNPHYTQHYSTNLSSKTVTPEDALWFARLPEKIQRGHFSIEEQKLLTPRKEEVILDAADEKFYKLGEKIGNRSLPSLSSCYTGPSSAASLDLDDYSSVWTGDEIMASDASLLDSFGWLETDLDLSLDDYHVHLAESADPKLQTPRQEPTLRKQKSFGSTFLSKETRSNSVVSRKSIEHWGSGWAPTTAVPPVPRVSTSHRPQTSSTAANGRDPAASVAPANWGSSWAPAPAPTGPPSSDGTISAIDQEATHYLNPEARLKLRLYLASPSKFDEALEFGFPTLKSSSSRPSFSARRPSTSTARSVCHPPATAKSYKSSPTFLDDGTTTTGSSYNPEPRLDLTSELSRTSTPLARDQISSLEMSVDQSMGSFQPSPMSASQSQKACEVPPPLPHQPWQVEREPYTRTWPAREMTLRMTLTRPDLRADDSVLYPRQSYEEPAPEPHYLKRSVSVSNKLGRQHGDEYYADNGLLKLEDLQLGDDATTTKHGKERPGGLRRFLSRKWE